VGWEENRRKLKRLMDQDKDSLLSKIKASQACKAKRRIHSLLPIGRQLPSHFIESRVSACMNSLLGKANAYNHKPASFILLSLSSYF